MRARSAFLGILAFFATHLSAQDLHVVLPGGCDTTITITAQRWPSTTERVRAHGGDTAVYTGPLLADVLRTACPALAQLNKKELAATMLLMEAADGYKAAYAWAELDTAYRAHPLLLALQKNSAPLDAKDGPLQLIMPNDERHARWVRQVNTVRIIRP
jgi:hypothetical protein